jgi:hypothetical protein
MSAGAEQSVSRDELAEALEQVAANRASAGELVTALAGLVCTLRGCVWLEGELRLELAAELGGVSVNLYTEHGGVRERVLAPVTLVIPLDELDVALQGAPALFAPLRMRHHKGKLIFVKKGVTVTVPPPHIVVASDSLVAIDDNPHEKPTVKKPAFVLPDHLESGARLRSDRDET